MCVYMYKEASGAKCFFAFFGTNREEVECLLRVFSSLWLQVFCMCRGFWGGFFGFFFFFALLKRTVSIFLVPVGFAVGESVVDVLAVRARVREAFQALWTLEGLLS